MVFSSVPVYLDPPNWQQQPNHQPRVINNESPQLLPPPPPPPPPPPAPPVGGSSGSSGTIRPGSMADRARLAKIPQPETALKCPRCESTNTKFCYFNNYSLSQPRHFCKTCRRYWTRGGALRSVPVGGGCRRNKRSKSNNNRSKSPAISSSSKLSTNNNSTNEHVIGHGLLPAQPLQLPILPPLHHLHDFSSGEIGLNFGPIQPPVLTSGGGGVLSGNGLVEQLRLQQVQQQFPFLADNLETQNGSTGLYSFESSSEVVKPLLDSGLTNQSAFVKMEDNQASGLNHSSRNFLGINLGSDQYWGGGGSNINAWTDLSTFNSSASHLL